MKGRDVVVYYCDDNGKGNTLFRKRAQQRGNIQHRNGGLTLTALERKGERVNTHTTRERHKPEETRKSGGINYTTSANNLRQLRKKRKTTRYTTTTRATS